MSDVVDKAEAWDAAASIPPKAQREIDCLRAALEACVAAHKTGRYEPMVAAIENAQNVLDDTK